MNGNDYYELEQSYIENHIEQLYIDYGYAHPDVDPWDFYDNHPKFQEYCRKQFEIADSGRGDLEYDAYKERQLT